MGLLLQINIITADLASIQWVMVLLQKPPHKKQDVYILHIKREYRQTERYDPQPERYYGHRVVHSTVLRFLPAPWYNTLTVATETRH